MSGKEASGTSGVEQELIYEDAVEVLRDGNWHMAVSEEGRRMSCDDYLPLSFLICHLWKERRSFFWNWITPKGWSLRIWILEKLWELEKGREYFILSRDSESQWKRDTCHLFVWRWLGRNREFLSYIYWKRSWKICTSYFRRNNGCTYRFRGPFLKIFSINTEGSFIYGGAYWLFRPAFAALSPVFSWSCVSGSSSFFQPPLLFLP